MLACVLKFVAIDASLFSLIAWLLSSNGRNGCLR